MKKKTDNVIPVGYQFPLLLWFFRWLGKEGEGDQFLRVFFFRSIHRNLDYIHGVRIELCGLIL